uniref:Creatinase N-terminal domain-containing protein n=1 Tax=Varroa destructor TaxID=109461 RepID=A0A7M7KVZ6_VARDE
MPTHSARLRALREQLAAQHLDGFVVPLTDEYMSEYVGGYAQRLGWLTGFGGSAGTAAVLPTAAAIFTDGRYTIQVREQVSADDWQYVAVPENSVADWLRANVQEGARVGYDPWLHTRAWVEQARDALATRGATLVAVEANPVDAVWDDRPAPSPASLSVHRDDHAGETSAAKRARVADWLGEIGADAAVIPALDSTAWLLNIRGQD